MLSQWASVLIAAYVLFGGCPILRSNYRILFSDSTVADLACLPVTALGADNPLVARQKVCPKWVEDASSSLCKEEHVVVLWGLQALTCPYAAMDVFWTGVYISHQIFHLNQILQAGSESDLQGGLLRGS